MPERFEMAEATTKRKESSFDIENMCAEISIKRQKTKDLCLWGIDLLLTAANYKPYLDWKRDEHQMRSQDSASSAESLSNSNSSASEIEDSPQHEGGVSPSYDSDRHNSGTFFPSQSSTAVSPSHSSASHSPTYDADAILPEVQNRLLGKQDERDDGQITCYCYKPHGGRNMIYCNECEKWLHFSCVKIRKDPDPTGPYTCPRCVARKETKRKSDRQRAKKKYFEFDT